ncbi:ribosome biogenesis GTPase Der [Chloroflexota bacterium]
MTRPIVAIVGRPNVGKSTLFNRLIGDRKAIVEGLPGTTRDRLYADVSLGGRELTLVDCGGLEILPTSDIGQGIKNQVEIAIAEADAILLLVDAREGVTLADEEVVEVLRRSRKPLVLVVNKVDNARQEIQVFQFYELGIGEPIPISAYHGKGIEEILEKVVSYLPPPPPAIPELELMKIAIVGRPNVGKSMLVNALIGEERSIVNDMAGTTRDAVDSVFSYGGESIVLIDTAGINKRGRIQQGIEQFSFIRTIRAIDRADVALLLIDAVEGITAQDIHILGYVREAYKGAILIVNKWDLVENEDVDLWIDMIRNKAKFMPYIEILFLSAKTGYGIEEILPIAKRIYEQRLKRLSTSLLGKFIKEAVEAHLPPKKGRMVLRILSAKQTGINPPTIVFTVNNAKLVHFSYQRYLENRLRQSFGFEGTPLRLIFRSRGEKVTKLGKYLG